MKSLILMMFSSTLALAANTMPYPRVTLEKMLEYKAEDQKRPVEELRKELVETLRLSKKWTEAELARIGRGEPLVDDATHSKEFEAITAAKTIKASAIPVGTNALSMPTTPSMKSAGRDYGDKLNGVAEKLYAKKLTDRDERTALVGVHGLIELSTETSLNILVKSLTDTNLSPRTRKEIARELTENLHQTYRTDIAKSQVVQYSLVEAFLNLKQGFTQDSIKELINPKFRTRPETVIKLVDAINSDPSELRRQNALALLKEKAGSRAIPTVVRVAVRQCALNDSSPMIRQEAMLALIEMFPTDEGTREFLETNLVKKLPSALQSLVYVTAREAGIYINLSGSK